MTETPAAGDPRLVALVETWKQACDDFVALVRSLPEEQGDLPTDLPGWCVRDNVAHTAHLEAVLAGAPEETIEVAEAPHLVGLQNYYTEQGVLARRGRTLAELADEIEAGVSARHAELLADPPTDGAAAPLRTPGGIGWNLATLLSNRPFDVWMHEQDIRRAVGRPGGYDGPVAAHVVQVLAGALPMVVGKRVSPPGGTTLRVVVHDAGQDFAVHVGEDGRAGFVDAAEATPTATVTLSAEDYVVLSGGRRAPEATTAQVDGDEVLGRKLLGALAVTP
jgi:uncharacterized protein (TIGR03083 family)